MCARVAYNAHTVALMRKPLLLLLVSTVSAASFGCSAGTDSNEQHSQAEEAWDSAGGNPFHPAHAYLAEYAVDQLKDEYPEIGAYRQDIINGSNAEIHDLPKKNAEMEALRIEVGGNNEGASCPELMWAHALDEYRAGHTRRAYFFLGALLHYVQDMGVPAHALLVYHQSSPSDWDNFEIMAFQDWEPDYSAVNYSDPERDNPVDYVGVSQGWTAADFHQAYPGVTYRRNTFPLSWTFARAHERDFVKARQARTGVVTTWALRSAARRFGNEGTVGNDDGTYGAQVSK